VDGSRHRWLCRWCAVRDQRRRVRRVTRAAHRSLLAGRSSPLAYRGLSGRPRSSPRSQSRPPASHRSRVVSPRSLVEVSLIDLALLPVRNRGLQPRTARHRTVVRFLAALCQDDVSGPVFT
jgi:hypothetical protein